MCETWTADSDSRLMVAHARILYFRSNFLKSRFFGTIQESYVANLVEDRSVNKVTILSTDAGRRAPSRSRKPLRLAYDSLRLASRLAVVSTAAA